MNTLTVSTIPVGHAMSAACGARHFSSGVVWVLKTPQDEALTCAIIQDEDCLVQFMTRPRYRGQGYMRATLDMLTELYDHLYVDCNVEGAALASLLGSGFVYDPSTQCYEYRKESHEDM